MPHVGFEPTTLRRPTLWTARTPGSAYKLLQIKTLGRPILCTQIIRKTCMLLV